MEIKELITESVQGLKVDVQPLFDGIDLTVEQKEGLSTAFETVIVATASQLAEQVVEKYKEQRDAEDEEAEEKRKEQEKEKEDEIKEAFGEAIQIYVENYLTEWAEENKIAIDNQIKANLFESLVGSLKNVVIEHNLVVPEEGVNVLDEAQQENTELRENLDRVMKENKRIKDELQARQMAETIKRLTSHLTESQVERVLSLTENVRFDDKFESRVKAMVTIVEGSKQDPENEEPKKGGNPDDQKSPDQVNENLNYGANVPTGTNNPMATYIKVAQGIK